MRVAAGRTTIARIMTALVCGVTVFATAAAITPGLPARASAASGSGDCFPVGLTWICLYNGNGPGSPGSGGSAKYTCTYTPASQAILQRTGTGPPQPGYQWDIMTCPGSNQGSLGGQLVQVSKKTGAPAISPFDLLKIAMADLSVPSLPAATAP